MNQHTDSGTIASAIDTSVIAFLLAARKLEKPTQNHRNIRTRICSLFVTSAAIIIAIFCCSVYTLYIHIWARKAGQSKVNISFITVLVGGYTILHNDKNPNETQTRQHEEDVWWVVKTPAHSQQTIKTAPYKKSGKFSLNKNKCTEFVPKLKWEVTFELGCEVNSLCKCSKDIKGFPKVNDLLEWLYTNIIFYNNSTISLPSIWKILRRGQWVSINHFQWIIAHINKNNIKTGDEEMWSPLRNEGSCMPIRGFCSSFGLVW